MDPGEGAAGKGSFGRWLTRTLTLLHQQSPANRPHGRSRSCSCGCSTPGCRLCSDSAGPRAGLLYTAQQGRQKVDGTVPGVVHSWLPLAARRTHNLRLRLPPTSDPGNWAVSIEAGSRFGYQLVWVVVLSNLIAIQLQTLAARLGLVTGKNLAQVPAWAGGRVEGRRTAFISVLAAVAGGAGCASHGT